MADDDDLNEVQKLLAALDAAFEKTRKKTVPLFPYDRKTNTIHLPRHIEKQLRALVISGNKIDAVKRVAELTGAGLRLSKDYIDDLPRKR